MSAIFPPETPEASLLLFVERFHKPFRVTCHDLLRGPVLTTNSQ
jgi:hypothetical protein